MARHLWPKGKTHKSSIMNRDKTVIGEPAEDTQAIVCQYVFVCACVFKAERHNVVGGRGSLSASLIMCKSVCVCA